MVGGPMQGRSSGVGFKRRYSEQREGGPMHGGSSGSVLRMASPSGSASAESYGQCVTLSPITKWLMLRPGSDVPGTPR